MKKCLLLTLAPMLLGPSTLAQNIPRFHELQEKLPLARESEIGKLIVEVGTFFLQTPYEGKTLEAEGAEQLTVRFASFDCFTFVESSLALARTLKQEHPDYAGFLSELEQIRYRGGELNGYTSRLHYTSDWSWDNAGRGILKNITHTIGGIPYKKTINFMTHHPGAYRQLASKEHLNTMAKVEKALNQRQHYYLPKGKIRQQERLIRQGDILAMTTSLQGLDVAHVGLAVKIEGRLFMLHASSANGRVEITREPLHEHLARVKNRTGIMVFRAQKP